MGDLTSIIMSMDTLQLSGIGLGVIGGIGLVTYKLLKKKPAIESLDGASAGLENYSVTPNTNGAKTSEDSGYTVDTQVELNHIRPRITDTPHVSTTETSSFELIESALVYDGYGSTEEAQQILADAMQRETHPKEKVRLHVIYKNYMTGKEKLEELLKRYPSFIKRESDGWEQLPDETDLAKIEPTLQSNQPDILLDDNIPVLTDVVEKQFAPEPAPVVQEPVVEPVQEFTPEVNHEEVLKSLVEENNAIDEIQKQESEEQTNNFFQEFGSLAQQIHKENEEDAKRNTTAVSKQVEVPVVVDEKIYNIWANYMSLSGGRMNLKNTFINLENYWGSVAAIAELQSKINREIGQDAAGNQIPWAIISVLPLKESV